MMILLSSYDFSNVVYRATATGTRSWEPCTGSHDDWLACVTAMACCSTP